MAHRGWKRDGFTPAKRAKAIEALGKYGNVADAARVAGVSDTTVYRHYNKDPDFARSCELERAKAAMPLETLAWERATQGAPETVIRGGEIVQIEVKPSDAMPGLLLRASDPKKYDRMSRGGGTRNRIERQSRRKIEADTRETMRREPVATDEEVKGALVKASWAHGIRTRAVQSAERAGEAEE